MERSSAKSNGRFPLTNGGVTNILSVDIEDYFQVDGFKESVAFSEWERHETRFHVGLEWLLQILDGTETKASSFILR